jgi:N-acetylmuramoyl-L-alanine amidase
MDILKYHLPQSSYKRPTIRIAPRYITIHSEAGCTARAKLKELAAEADLHQKSYHLLVDECEIIECIPLNELAYHAGDGRGSGNYSSMGLLICTSGNDILALAKAARLTACLLYQYGWSTEAVVQHNRWSSVDCPKALRQGCKWHKWLRDVEAEKRRLEKADEIRRRIHAL